MELSIHQASKLLGEVFPFAWHGPLEEQTYCGRTVRFLGDADLVGSVVGDGQGFTVTGNAKVTLASVCARCNKAFEEPFAFSFEDRFVKAVLREEGDESYPFEGDVIDLTQAFMDELFLQLPMVSLCKPDCKGLCPVCGVDLNRFRCNCAEKTRNSAFDALKALSFEDKEV